MGTMMHNFFIIIDESEEAAKLFYCLGFGKTKDRKDLLNLRTDAFCC